MSIHYARKSFYSGIIFFGTVLGLSIGYSALFGGLTASDKVGTGSGLSATAWNKIIDGVLDLDTRVSKFTFSGSNVGIGTPTPQTTLDVNGPISSAGGKEVRNIFTWKDPLGTSRTTPLHIKTTWRTTNEAMYRFVIEGYLYSPGLSINSSCVGYLYAGTDSIYNGACKDSDTGVFLTQYKSSDGYLVLKVTPNTNWYFAGFGISLQQFNLTGVKALPSFTAYEQAGNL